MEGVGLRLAVEAKSFEISVEEMGGNPKKVLEFPQVFCLKVVEE